MSGLVPLTYDECPLGAASTRCCCGLDCSSAIELCIIPLLCSHTHLFIRINFIRILKLHLSIYKCLKILGHSEN